MPEETYRILVADDDPPILELLGEYLATRGHQVKLVPNGELALDALQHHSFDVLVTDMKMPGTDGLSLLKHVRENNLPVATIMMTGYGTIESAITAMKSGAQNYLLKPFRLREVHNSIRQAVEARREEQATLRLQHLTELQLAVQTLTGPAALEGLYKQIAQRSMEELGATGALLAFFEPAEQRWVEYVRIGESDAFQGLDLDGLADLVQRDTQPHRNPQCWFGTEGHLLAVPVRVSLEAGPAHTIGLLAVTEMRSILPNPERALQVYSHLLGQCMSTQILLDRQSPSPVLSHNSADNLWVQTLEEDLLQVGKRLSISESEVRAAAWALRLRANESFHLRDLVESGQLDIMTMGGGGLPMTLLKELTPILLALEEREDGHGSPKGLPGKEIPAAARLANAFAHWNWLQNSRFYAPRLNPTEAQAALSNAALKTLGEDEVNALIDQTDETT